ncbi:MAG TPA: M23 family metallopeptidase [Anaeromyxobacteraceae bacterium]|nr:M23 family metallopeptidase [Anaeromyxobacteraceae bacterium]
MTPLLLALALAADPRVQLEVLEARRAAEAAAARLLQRQERSVLDTLGDAERALDEARAGVARTDADRAEAEAALARAREEEGRARAVYRARLDDLRPRLDARRRMGRAGELAVLVSAPTLADLVSRRYLFDRILGRDLAVFGEAKAALETQRRARAEIEEQTARIAALAEQAEEQRAAAAARREERETLLGALRTARRFHERAAAEAEEQTKRLAEFVTSLPPKGGDPLRGVFARLKGRMRSPAAGPVTVGFGRVVNPRFNTVTVQNGVDIAAPAGSPVRAVAPGRVVHSGWFKGYGNLVIVDHGDGYHTLVAHLASMRTAMGESVSPGDVIGTVGDSGSLKGPYLYFEIRERGRPVDPKGWLGS